MRELKLGDKVELNREVDAFHNISLPTRFVGKIVTIIDITKRLGIQTKFYFREEGGGDWSFTKPLIRKIITNKKINWRERLK